MIETKLQTYQGLSGEKRHPPKSLSLGLDYLMNEAPVTDFVESFWQIKVDGVNLAATI